MIYILIVIANSYNGVTVSQQEYASKTSCEVAAIVTEEMVKDVKWTFGGITVKTQCISKQ